MEIFSCFCFVYSYAGEGSVVTSGGLSTAVIIVKLTNKANIVIDDVLYRYAIQVYACPSSSSMACAYPNTLVSNSIFKTVSVSLLSSSSISSFLYDDTSLSSSSAGVFQYRDAHVCYSPYNDMNSLFNDTKSSCSSNNDNPINFDNQPVGGIVSGLIVSSDTSSYKVEDGYFQDVPQPQTYPDSNYIDGDGSQSSSPSSSNDSMLIGVIVGVIGFILLIIVIVLVVKYIQRKNNNQSNSQHMTNAIQI